MGGALLVAMVAWIISLFVFKKMEPHRRAIFTAGSAWIICAAITGLAFPGGFYGAFVGLSIGAALVGFERYVHYSKHWTDEPETSQDAETFR